MEEKQLPKEVVAEINEQADKYGFVVPYNGSNKFYNDDKLEGYKAGATAYATKRHQAMTRLEENHNRLLKADDLLKEVFRKHESGLLPDRFIYEKIKSFLYGE